MGLIGQILTRLADRYAAEKHVISRGPGVDYLTRWTLKGKRFGAPGDTPIFLHRFVSSDPDEMHDHPFGFTSLILAGGYWERTPAPGWKDGVGPVRHRWYGPGRILRRPATWIHSVVLPPGRDCWTLVFRGVKVRLWGFFALCGYIPWREHMRRMETTGVICPEE